MKRPLAAILIPNAQKDQRFQPSESRLISPSDTPDASGRWKRAGRDDRAGQSDDELAALPRVDAAAVSSMSPLTSASPMPGPPLGPLERAFALIMAALICVSFYTSISGLLTWPYGFKSIG